MKVVIIILIASLKLVLSRNIYSGGFPIYIYIYIITSHPPITPRTGLRPRHFTTPSLLPSLYFKLILIISYVKVKPTHMAL